MSCSVRRTSQTSVSSSDTLSERIEVRQVPVTLPSEMTRLRLPIQTLPMLPEGAGYSVRQGRLLITATRHGDSLHLEAVTDSLTVTPRVETRYSVRHKTLRATTHETREHRTGLQLPSLLIPIITLPIILITLALWHKIRRRLPQRR